MLDLNHPQTPHVFAAAKQLDLILRYSKLTTIGTGKRRFDCYQIVEPSFNALRWLNENRFDASTDLANAIDKLDAELRTLANAEIPESAKHTVDLKNCPRCDSTITESGTCNPIGTKISVPAERYCFECLSPVIDRMSNCDRLFGTDAI